MSDRHGPPRCQLLDDVVVGLRVKPGKPAKEDNEYVRQGTAVVLLAYDYERGIRYTQTRKRRTKADYAEFMQQIVFTHYADIEFIDLVQDKGTGPPVKHAQVRLVLRAFTVGPSPDIES